MVADRFALTVRLARFLSIPDKGNRPEETAKAASQIRKVTLAASKQDSNPLAPLSFNGDWCIACFTKAVEAHNFAVKVLLSSEVLNKKGASQSADNLVKHVCVSIAFGNVRNDGLSNFSGTGVDAARALNAYTDSAALDNIRICENTFQQLPSEIKSLYAKDDSTGRGGKDESIGAFTYVKPLTVPENQKISVAAKERPKHDRRCFIISPIDDHTPRIADVFKGLIGPACSRIGFDPFRADQIPGPERIPAITRNLSSWPLAIAYMGNPSSGWNDDVMLEIGYRLSTGLPMVLLSEEPEALSDGRVPSFKELLPFHLLHKTIIVIQRNLNQTIDRLVEEMNICLTQRQSQYWNTVHPIIEVKFSNMRKDLALTYVSPEAKNLFQIEEDQPSFEDMQKQFKERMPELQYQAYYSERVEILRRILADGLGLDEPGRAMPRARIPIIFKDQLTEAQGRPVGFLPLIVRYSMETGTIHLRILYLKVWACLKMDPAGFWVCEL